jgi:hypothetical protein
MALNKTFAHVYVQFRHSNITKKLYNPYRQTITSALQKTSIRSTMVEPSPHHPKVKGSNPGTDTDTGRKEL